MEGETLTDAMGYFMATLVILPLVMAGVTLLISDRVNRWANLIAGLALGLLGTYSVVAHIVGEGFNVHILMMVVAVAGAFLIAGLSLAGLRYPTSEPAAPASELTRPREETTV